MKPAKEREAYIVLIGFNFGKDNKRHEVGEVVRDLPAKVAQTLLTQQPAAIRPAR